MQVCGHVSEKSLVSSDYAAEELVEIAHRLAVRHRLELSESATSALFEMIVDARRNGDKTFGNAWSVRGLLEDLHNAVASRIVLEADDQDNLLPNFLEVTVEDVHSITPQNRHMAEAIPIDPLRLQRALAQLSSLTGLQSVKSEIDDLVQLCRYYREIGRSVTSAFSLHCVFTGNPGTGKTTVARIIADVFAALGLLERGHLVECSRQSLVAEYVGQTAPKTTRMIDTAMGGVLFIDEAYALATDSERDFGQEAIQVLLKRMEDDRGKFAVIVAGYTMEMRHFLRSNPGLESRFNRFLHFDDYSPSEMLEIAVRMLAGQGYVLGRDVLVRVLDCFRHQFRAGARRLGTPVSSANSSITPYAPTISA